jgi:hypothetical protein
MPPTDADVDALYQGLLAEFTPARNALAKRAGKDAAAIRALDKPSVPAWAVNQLYWRVRRAYDAVIAAAAALRRAHGRRLAGASVDVAGVEHAHRQAVKAALAEIQRILAAAGDPASPATLAAVAETLDALPGADRPGRLVRPLKRAGFEALAGLTLAAPRTTAAPAAARDTARDRAERRRAWQTARTAATRAHAAAARAQSRVDDLVKQRADVSVQLERVIDEIESARARAKALEAEAARADADVTRLAVELDPPSRT